MNTVDPLAGEIGERRQVLFGRQPSRLEAAHLACRGCAATGCLAANNPAHRGIMAKTFGVVDVLVTSQAAEHGLPQHADQSMPAVLARAGVGELLACYVAEAERVVEFAIGEQT